MLGVYPLNIADFAAVEAMAQALAQEGAFDQLYNVAGYFHLGQHRNTGNSALARPIRYQCHGHGACAKSLYPAMIAAKRGGHIVNVFGGGLFACLGTVPGASNLPCAASEVLRFDLAPQGIHVSLVCPGAVDTGWYAPFISLAQIVNTRTCNA